MGFWEEQRIVARAMVKQIEDRKQRKRSAWAGERVQWVRALDLKPDDLGLNPGTHMMRKLQVVF